MDVLVHHRGVCTKEKQGAISGSRGIRAAPNSTTKDKKTHLQAFSKSCLSDILKIIIIHIIKWGYIMNAGAAVA